VTKHILVLDDWHTLLTLMRMLLEDENYQVSVLQRGEGAIDRIRELMPDLVILDLKLADASGTDILVGLRAQESTADIPVIVYSAAVLETEALSNLIAGNPTRYANVSVLQKPFDLDTLLERVQQVLSATQSSEKGDMRFLKSTSE
jgi:DNA-binding response OmpR family regulator